MLAATLAYRHNPQASRRSVHMEAHRCGMVSLFVLEIHRLMVCQHGMSDMSHFICANRTGITNMCSCHQKGNDMS